MLSFLLLVLLVCFLRVFVEEEIAPEWDLLSPKPVGFVTAHRPSLNTSFSSLRFGLPFVMGSASMSLLPTHMNLAMRHLSRSPRKASTWAVRVGSAVVFGFVL